MVFNKENWMFFLQCKTRPIFFIEFIEGIPRIMFHHIFLHFYHRIESNTKKNLISRTPSALSFSI